MPVPRPGVFARVSRPGHRHTLRPFEPLPSHPPLPVITFDAVDITRSEAAITDIVAASSNRAAVVDAAAISGLPMCGSY